MCDILIVGVLTDKATMEMKRKPIMPFEERLFIISALKYVDAAVTQETYSPLNNIHDIKPDILFESSSHKNPCVNPHGRTINMPYYPNQTSTKIKQKILEEWDGS
jgi:bifunctional ADP-heptose synthase (sugar kinase/adenylyltransferase)